MPPRPSCRSPNGWRRIPTMSMRGSSLLMPTLRWATSMITLRGIGTVADGGPLELGALVRGDYVPPEGWRMFGGCPTGRTPISAWSPA